MPRLAAIAGTALTLLAASAVPAGLAPPLAGGIATTFAIKTDGSVLAWAETMACSASAPPAAPAARRASASAS
jgi:hypothetical protein